MKNFFLTAAAIVSISLPALATVPSPVVATPGGGASSAFSANASGIQQQLTNSGQTGVSAMNANTAAIQKCIAYARTPEEEQACLPQANAVSAAGYTSTATPSAAVAAGAAYQPVVGSGGPSDAFAANSNAITAQMQANLAATQTAQAAFSKNTENCLSRAQNNTQRQACLPGSTGGVYTPPTYPTDPGSTSPYAPSRN